jgi:hypothetical protein
LRINNQVVLKIGLQTDHDWLAIAIAKNVATEENMNFDFDDKE